MKKNLLLIYLMLFSLLGIAQEISLGTGTSAGSSPVNLWYKNSLNQQIFTKQEINADGPGVVTALKFYGSDMATFSNTPNVKFWIGHTTKSSFTSTSDWVSLDDLTLIHDGTITRADGVTTITITGGFNYNNIDNIAIVGFKEEFSGNAGISSRFYTYTGAANTVLYKDLDSGTYTTLDNYQTVNGTRSASKSRITFVGLTPSSIPPCPLVSAPAANTQTVAILPTITWAAVSGAISYNVKIGTTSGGSDILNQTDVTATSYTLTTALLHSTTYFLTVDAVGTGGTSSGCSELQFTTIPPPPVNDDCVNAVSLTVNPDYDYAVVTAGTTLSATESMAAAPCSGAPNDDVWYSFVATNTSHQIKISNVVSLGTISSTDMYFQVLSGACSSTSSLLCSDPDTNVVNNLTIGDTYYIRVYTYSSNVNAFCSFNIGIGTPPPPPANDECVNAITLTPGAIFNDNAVVGTNSGATHNTNDPTVTCESFNFTTNGKDVWYKVIIPASGTLTLETNNNESSDMTDTGMAAYAGTCANLTLIECDADDSLDGSFSLINLAGRTPGEEILVRVWGFNNNEGSFKVSAYDATLSSEDFTQTNIKLYPNPFTTDLHISNTENIVKATVVDLTGKVVKTFNNPSAILPLSQLSSGIYMVTLEKNNGSKQTIKAIKK